MLTAKSFTNPRASVATMDANGIKKAVDDLVNVYIYIIVIIISVVLTLQYRWYSQEMPNQMW